MTQISEIYITQSNGSQQKHPNKISFLGFWAIDSKKAINANVIQYDNINLERKKKGLITVSYTHLTLPTIYSV